MQLLGVYSDPKGDLDGRQNIDCSFMSKTVKFLGKHDQEVDRVKWWPLDQLPDKIAFDHRQMIADYKRQFTRK